MPTKKRDGLPEFWISGIAKALVGEKPCMFEPWIKGHYRIEKVQRPDDGKLTKWRTEHTEQLQAAIQRFTAEGWKCSVERYMRLVGTTAILAGKSDLITQKTDCRPTVRDVKSGVPRDSDVAQVMIYMIAIPLAWGSPQMQFAGEVIYPTHSIQVTPEDAAELRPKLFALLRQLGSPTRPPASPAEYSCRFCDVSKADCPDRMAEDAAVPVLTSEF